MVDVCKVSNCRLRSSMAFRCSCTNSWRDGVDTAATVEGLADTVRDSCASLVACTAAVNVFGSPSILRW